MNQSNPATGSLQENTIFLSCQYTLKEEFVKEYRRKYDEKAKAEELYLLILSELIKAVIECDIEQFKKLINLIDYISEIEDPKALNDFYRNSNNPLRSTNFVILACKHNKVKLLKYLFENSNKFINNILIGVRRTAILPQDEDEVGHNAFYYAIRSGNIDLLDTLCNEWPGNYFTVCLEELDKIISRAYEDLKLKNVPLSEEIEIFVESKLIDLRFFSDGSRNAQSSLSNIKAQSTPHTPLVCTLCIKERIEIILENINLIKAEYSNAKDVNENFLFIARFIAQNIHILKRQLKSTYNRLPWEEMEFCLVSFVSSYMKSQEINLFYRVTLNKQNILNHLENFAKRLEDEKCCLANVNIDELAKLPKVQREKVVADIISNYSEFEDLYNDYQYIRDIYSLEKIHKWLELASSANPDQKEGQLIIIRVLQVTGEFLKNTLESPKLSNTTSELLLLSLPTNTRKIITNLRNSLSHAASLSKRIEIEGNTDNCFFNNIQNDVKKVGVVVTDIFYSYKMKMIRLYLKKIVTEENLDEVQDILETLSNVHSDGISLENFIMMEQIELEKLVKDLNDAITDKTFYDEFLLDKMNQIISSTKIKSGSIITDYLTRFAGLQLLGVPCSRIRNDPNIIREKKLLAEDLLKNISIKYKCHRLKEIAGLSEKIFISVWERMQDDIRDKIFGLIYRIFCIAEFETGDIKWINEFKKKLNKKGSNISVYKDSNTYNDSEEKYNKQFTVKLSELKNVLKNNTEETYKSDKKLQALVEMYVLDIMSILESKKKLENNLLFLDDNYPILTGKCLRNHIAHDNALVNLLSDPSKAVILNAKKVISENLIENTKKLGKLVKDDPLRLKEKYIQSLNIVTNQERMFSAVEEGNFEHLKCCLKRGADIDARNINSWTLLHFAAKGPSIEVIKFLLDQNLDVNAKDVNDQTPFHIAATYGRKDHILKFFEMKADLLCVDDEDNAGRTPLHFAAQNGHNDVVQILLENKANTSALDLFCYSPLHYAIFNNHIEAAKILLDKEVDVDYNEAVGGSTPLHLAARNGRLELVNFLLEKGANVNARNDDEGTPLHTAAAGGHLKVVNALISYKVDIDSRNKDGCTPLHFAAQNGHEDIVKALLENGANACLASTEDGKIPLHSAAQKGHLNIVTALVTALLNLGFDTCTKDKNNITVLHYAAGNGHKVVAEFLISKGAEINASNNANSMTPLHAAAKNGHKDIIDLLIKKKADVNAKNSDGMTPLHIVAAFMNDCENIIDLLIKNGADVNVKNNAKVTPLHIVAAIMNDCEKIIALLIENKAEVNARDNEGKTPLHNAVLSGHKGTVAYLLQNGAEVNYRTNLGFTPLHAAVFGGYKDIINLLIIKGAFINSRDINNLTPLNMAVKAGQKEIVEVLIAEEAEVNIQGNYESLLVYAIKCKNKEILEILIKKANIANANDEHSKVLGIAVSYGNRDIVKILLDNGADVNTKDSSMETPLHSAAKSGDTEIVKALITKGADVNAFTINNITPLYIAAQEGHVEVVTVLIDNGATLNVKSSDGTTPLHIAAQEGHVEVVTVLIDKGATLNVKSSDGTTPLHIAGYNGCINVVKVLLDKKVNDTITDNEKRIPLQLAADMGHLQVVEMLLQYKDIDINTKFKNRYNWTLLHIASSRSNLEMVKYLVNKGANINVNSNHQMPIHIAAREGATDIVEFFCSKGQSINERDRYNQTLLDYAVIKGHSSLVKYLIEQGADVNAIHNGYGITPMHIAAEKGFIDVIKLLLENGAFYNIRNNCKKKPVVAATDKSVITLLSSITKLFKAVKQNNYPNVEKYIEAGAYVNAKSVAGAGGMPIHYAAWKGNEDIVNILLQNKADPNVISKKGYSPLHYAAKFSHLKIVKTLLSKGAIYNAVSGSGKTPLDFTEDTNIAKLFTFLGESFENIEKNENVFDNLLNILDDVDTLTLKAIMNACDSKNRTLTVATMQSNFSHVEILSISPVNEDKNVVDGEKLLNQGKNQEAFDIFKRAFIERKEFLGPNNPGTLVIQRYMAKALIGQGNYKEGLNMLEIIVQKQERMLGLNNEDTLITRSMIASTHHMMGKDEDAYNICQEVFRKQKEKHGPNHLDTLYTQYHMVLVLDRLGKHEEALNICREMIEISKSTPDVLDTDNLGVKDVEAMILGNQGKYEEALKIYEEVLDKKKSLLSPDHPSTLLTMQHIAFTHFMQRKFNEAWKALENVLNIQKVILGEDHPESLRTQYLLGTVFYNQCKFNRALKVYSDMFDSIKKVFGPNHELVLDVEKSIKNITEGCLANKADVTHCKYAIG